MHVRLHLQTTFTIDLMPSGRPCACGWCWPSAVSWRTCATWWVPLIRIRNRVNAVVNVNTQYTARCRVQRIGSQPTQLSPTSYLCMQIACVRAQSVHVRCNKLFTSQTAADYGRIMCTSLVGAIRAERPAFARVGLIRVQFGQRFRVSAGCRYQTTAR